MKVVMLVQATKKRKTKEENDTLMVIKGGVFASPSCRRG
jgi:hypothetical protein